MEIFRGWEGEISNRSAKVWSTAIESTDLSADAAKKRPAGVVESSRDLESAMIENLPRDERNLKISKTGGVRRGVNCRSNHGQRKSARWPPLYSLADWLSDNTNAKKSSLYSCS